MLNKNEIIKNAFNENVQIIDIIKCGLRCETYVVKVKEEKYIFQIYLENAIYQAKKKYDIFKTIDNKLVPKAIKFKECTEYSYLITEYMEGKTLQYYRKADSQFSFKDISVELSKFLGQIHSITNNIYGWIDNTGVKAKNTLIDYIKSEYNRIITNFDNFDFEIKENILSKVNNAIEIINGKSTNIKKSCLCWYDINSGNILITKQEKLYKLNAVVDSGGARWGIPEWDIAFIKMQLCNTQEEFEFFLKKYKQENPQIIIDMELVNALSIIVEFDVMAIELSAKVIILPIPFDTNFEREFEVIHEHILNEY